MRTLIIVLIPVIFLTFGCEKNDTNSISDSLDGFCIMSNEELVLDHNDFEYYDYSSHLIYMKNNESFANDINDFGSFTVMLMELKYIQDKYSPCIVRLCLLGQ